jgi:hypothetical protein
MVWVSIILTLTLTLTLTLALALLLLSTSSRYPLGSLSESPSTANCLVRRPRSEGLARIYIKRKKKC